MKRTFTLFFAMLLCLVGTTARAEVYGLPSSLKSQGGVDGNKVKPVAGYAGKVSGRDAYYIPVGRVFIKSLADPQYGNDEDMYLTSLSNVMGLAKGATSYWSIWDIAFDENSSTITIVNEGNRDIMTPLQRFSKTSTTDAGYLYYNIAENSNTGYGVGNCNVAANRNFEWTVDANGRFTLRAEATTLTRNYMYFDAVWNDGSNQSGVKNTGDHVAKSGNIVKSTDRTTPNRNLWSIVPVTPKDEAEMFARNVQELNGYVGGVVTLTNVDKVEKLKSINDNTTTTCEYLKDGTIENEVGAAAKMKEILDIIADAKEYGQELVEGRPFFLESMCSYRPSLYSRLTYSSETRSGQNGWVPVNKSNVTNETLTGVFYVEKKGVNGSNVIYIKNGNTTRYISKNQSNSEYFSASTATTAISDALNFEIDPVIPGIWRIKDVNPIDSYKTKPYLTISQYGGKYDMTHYDLTEPSTLWKFKTYTTFDYTLKADPSGSGNNYTGYTTYGRDLDSKLPANGVKAYMATNLVWDNNEMQITMTEANTATLEGQKFYLLKGGYGYLITKPGVSEAEAGKVNENQLARFMPDADYDTGLVKFAEDNGTPNWLEPVPNDGKVTEADWEKWFYLTYVKEGETYTHYNGQDVKGYGIGFYRLAPGKSFARGKARISWDNSFGDKSKYLEKSKWNTRGVKGQMVFVDSEGETTDVLTIGADGSLFHEENTYFDLSGRRVAEPSKGGIYIKNGKKVLY